MASGRSRSALAVEIGFAGFRVADQDVARLERRRAAQRVVDALPDEVREVGDLRVGEAAARRAGLHRVPLLQERSDRVAASIAQHDRRANQVRAALGAARARAVAGDAFGRVDLPAAIGAGRIDAVPIGRADVGPGTGRNRRLTSARPGGWRRLVGRRMTRRSQDDSRPEARGRSAHASGASGLAVRARCPLLPVLAAFKRRGS